MRENNPKGLDMTSLKQVEYITVNVIGTAKESDFYSLQAKVNGFLENANGKWTIGPNPSQTGTVLSQTLVKER